MLTANQLQHRAYLVSPLWRSIRAKIISDRGEICERCGEYGNDVHHLTYERVGGNELDEDLQVLCRQCHEAIHAMERATRRQGNRTRSCTVELLFSKLSDPQKRMIESKFGGNAFSVLTSPSEIGVEARKMAMRMLGIGILVGHEKIQCKVGIKTQSQKEFLKKLQEVRASGQDVKKFRREFWRLKKLNRS